MTPADRLRRRADEIRALGEEHTHGSIVAPFALLTYELAEFVLREVAEAFDPTDDEEHKREAA